MRIFKGRGKLEKYVDESRFNVYNKPIGRKKKHQERATKYLLVSLPSKNYLIEYEGTNVNVLNAEKREKKKNTGLPHINCKIHI